MSVEVFFQIVEALAVVIGVGFAMVQVRQYRRDKHREAALERLHSFQTPSFARIEYCLQYARRFIEIRSGRICRG